MMGRETPEISLASDGLVTSRNYASHGYRRVFWGAYAKVTTGEGDTWDDRRAELIGRAKAAIVAFGSKGAVLYGPTALEVLGVALPRSLQDWHTCHLAIPAPLARPTRQSIVAHRLTHLPAIYGRVNGLPVLHPVDHWLQLSHATIDELVEVGDGLVRRQHPLLTMEEVRRRVDELAGAQGVKRVRAALRWVIPGTDSLMETVTRLILVHAGLPTPAVNCAVRCPSAGRVYHVDMGYEVEKVAVEYDGVVHSKTKAQMDIDAARRRDLQDEGWIVITVTSMQLSHPEDIVRSVETALHIRRSALRAVG